MTAVLHRYDELPKLQIMLEDTNNSKLQYQNEIYAKNCINSKTLPKDESNNQCCTAVIRFSFYNFI